MVTFFEKLTSRRREFTDLICRHEHEIISNCFSEAEVEIIFFSLEFAARKDVHILYRNIKEHMDEEMSW